jgi:hypothetical protein
MTGGRRRTLTGECEREVRVCTACWVEEAKTVKAKAGSRSPAGRTGMLRRRQRTAAKKVTAKRANGPPTSKSGVKRVAATKRPSSDVLFLLEESQVSAAGKKWVDAILGGMDL